MLPRQTKDRLFRFLFEKDREALLQLYNALNGTDYRDASRLQIVTIENAVYIVMKNDLAFVITGTLNLYEHQSTYNPNMPVRFLIYLAEEYQMIVEQALRLSDAFENKERKADVELTVRMLNINHGHNKALMEKCRTLEEFDVEKYERTIKKEDHASGLQEGRALAVLTILEQKGTVPADIKDRILSQNDEVILKQWLLAAASVEDIKTFREKTEIM